MKPFMIVLFIRRQDTFLLFYRAVNLHTYESRGFTFFPFFIHSNLYAVVQILGFGDLFYRHVWGQYSFHITLQQH